MNKEFIKIIKEICNELEIDVQLLCDDFVIVLKKGKVTKYIYSFNFDLNGVALGKIFDDKYGTYELLKNIDVPVVECELLSLKDTLAKFDNSLCKPVYKYLYQHKKNIVIKPNIGTNGKGVYHITCDEEVKPILSKLFIGSLGVCLSPYYDIKSEYRIVILNNKPELIFEKIRPEVIGDGEHNLKELLVSFNSVYFKNNKNLKEFDYNRILKAGEEFTYEWKFNLKRGANISEKIPKETKDKLLEIIKKIIKEIDIPFVTIDIIKTVKDEFMVLEINSGVCLKQYMFLAKDGEKKVKKIYQKAIMEMFNL